MIFNLSATEFHLATRLNGEKIIEVLNDSFAPGIVTIIADKRNNAPLIVLDNVSDINLRRHIFDAVDQALDEISPNCDSFMQFAQAIDGLQYYPRQSDTISDTIIDMDDGTEFAEIYPWQTPLNDEAIATAIAG